jgi:hypothetical protein
MGENLSSLNSAKYDLKYALNLIKLNKFQILLLSLIIYLCFTRFFLVQMVLYLQFGIKYKEYLTQTKYVSETKNNNFQNQIYIYLKIQSVGNVFHS